MVYFDLECDIPKMYQVSPVDVVETSLGDIYSTVDVKKHAWGLVINMIVFK